MNRWSDLEDADAQVWYLIDEERRTDWITYAGAGHPSETAYLVRSPRNTHRLLEAIERESGAGVVRELDEGDE